MRKDHEANFITFSFRALKLWRKRKGRWIIFCQFMLLRLTEAGITIWNGKKTIYQGTYVVCVGLRIFVQNNQIVNDLQIASRKIKYVKLRCHNFVQRHQKFDFTELAQQCGNCCDLVAHIFGKNFVKITFLLFSAKPRTSVLYQMATKKCLNFCPSKESVSRNFLLAY